ncbi:MAG: hypothetical protein H0V56_14180 [Chthoniobacterales bacterium]|nr:hypothetical protein [Chthoniobacterales bacterium]
MKKTARTTANIHAVVGSDESEVKRAAAELAAHLAPADAGDFGLEVIDGCGDNVEQSASRVRAAIEALQTLPFFGGKLVWLKNANCLGDSVIGRSAAVQTALEELGDTLEAGLPDGVTFLLSSSEVDKRRSFYKSLVKRADLQVIEKLDASRSGWEEEATEIVRGRAKGGRNRFRAEQHVAGATDAREEPDRGARGGCRLALLGLACLAMAFLRRKRRVARDAAC